MSIIPKLILSFFIALAAGIILAPAVIRFFCNLKVGQEIRDEGPAWHNTKSGTPTMGGIIFIIACMVSALIMAPGNLEVIMLVFLSVSFGVVGFVDDFIKIKLKRNLGLTEKQKLALQIVASLLFAWVLRDTLSNVQIIIPFTKISFNIGMWYLPVAVLVSLSSVNAVNLTDGLDGLASSITVVVTIFFTFVAFLLKATQISLFGCALAGSVCAFLLFNKYPAKIFMGDTGSLFLGGALAGMSILTGTPLFLIIAGGVFVMETLSVIIQVFVFKATGKRVFKMAPIHHHFEMSGYRETRIVIIFTLLSLLLCIIAFGGFLLYMK
ncbi:MAG: phospho-N-acetylmuramoyl-pentapeptide-transferase [Bacillota bacterium]|nr:phospho-N-acetylmuramoyl-pentapeptide-transferase [Bacillota bacterium]